MTVQKIIRFLKIRTCFMQNYMELKMKKKKKIDPKTVGFAV